MTRSIAPPFWSVKRSNSCAIPASSRPRHQSKVEHRPSSAPAAATVPTAATPEADGGTRTPDPIITSDVLYQLSYVGAGVDGSDRSGA
jgi:hypothetical protein